MDLTEFKQFLTLIFQDVFSPSMYLTVGISHGFKRENMQETVIDWLYACVNHSVVSDSATYRLKSPRLLCPCDSPGNNTGVGCNFLLQGIFLTQGSNPGLHIVGRHFYCLILGWKKHKLESRLLGEISITSDMQMTPPLWQKVKRN